MDIETFLGNKGFEIGTDGAKYFSMLLEDVIFALEENIPKEIIREKVIPSAKDFYYRFLLMEFYFHWDFFFLLKKIGYMNYYL